MTAQELAKRLDAHLRTAEIPDYPNAFNGLQMDREGVLRKVGFAVDAAEATIHAAASRGADMLVVHHGLFWGGVQPLVGRQYRRFKAALNSNLGIYSARLPLDVHPIHGNNAVLARSLGVEIEGSFGEFKGMPIGIHGKLDLRRDALAARLDELLGCRIRMIAGGPERLRRVGVITGGAGSMLESALDAGLDAFITGEGAHHNYFDAMEGKINLYLCGHYATEIWGVQALAEHVRAEHGLECFFIDHPTGL